MKKVKPISADINTYIQVRVRVYVMLPEGVSNQLRISSFVWYIFMYMVKIKILSP